MSGKHRCFLTYHISGDHQDHHVLTYYRALYQGAKYAWKAHEAYPLLQTLQAPTPAINQND